MIEHHYAHSVWYMFCWFFFQPFLLTFELLGGLYRLCWPVIDHTLGMDIDASRKSKFIGQMFSWFSWLSLLYVWIAFKGILMTQPMHGWSRMRVLFTLSLRLARRLTKGSTHVVFSQPTVSNVRTHACIVGDHNYKVIHWRLLLVNTVY
jgi:hypothetical protein